MLERIANPAEPPLGYQAIVKIRKSFDTNTANREVLKDELKSMEKSFRGRGDLKHWTPEILGEIDDCFVKAYMEDDEPVASLFFPGCPDNYNRFLEYCNGVDQVLRRHPNDGPKFGREYFAYYSIWQMQEYGFPVPLGTASVVEALNKITSNVRAGFTEVSKRSRGF